MENAYGWPQPKHSNLTLRFVAWATPPPWATDLKPVAPQGPHYERYPTEAQSAGAASSKSHVAERGSGLPRAVTSPGPGTDNAEEPLGHTQASSGM